MDKHTIVTAIFTKLAETFQEAGLPITDEEKAEQLAKILGLVKGIRKVGGLAPTDEGMLFAGVDPSELQRAKELAEVDADLARLEAQAAAVKAKRAALVAA